MTFSIDNSKQEQLIPSHSLDVGKNKNLCVCEIRKNMTSHQTFAKEI